MIKRLRLVEVADVQGHVPNHRPRRHAGPDRVTGELHERADIQRVNRPDVVHHRERPTSRAADGRRPPRPRARPDRRRSNRLAVAVIGHADLEPCVCPRCAMNAPRAGAIRQEVSEVIRARATHGGAPAARQVSHEARATPNRSRGSPFRAIPLTQNR